MKICSPEMVKFRTACCLSYSPVLDIPGSCTGGVLFKVYVIGDAIKVVRRYSLPDLGEGDQVSYGVKAFPRVSSAAATVEEADLDPEVAGSGCCYYLL